MPSGRSHDAITLLLAVPFAVAVYAVTRDVSTVFIAVAAFVFAGVMFGPDLDTKSKQYSRWGPLRLIWIPYRTIFKHRSRWSHGLIFGTLFRVVYFLGIATLIAFAAIAAYTFLTAGVVPSFATYVREWRSIGTAIGDSAIKILFIVFVGMWTGAASHTITDIATTYIKTGRVDAFL